MKVLIFGSCVTRDALEFDDSQQLELVNYFARSSLASAYSRKSVKGIDLQKINSSFQKRIVKADLEKKFQEYLSTAVFDILVYDPIDERFPLLKMQGGEICTFSNELAQTEVYKYVEGIEMIASGSEEFYRLWERGWSAFITQLNAVGKLDVLRINKVFWASQSKSGEKYLPSYSQEKIDIANKFLDKLYKRMAQDLLKSQFYNFENDLMVGADMHKWGRSPFHFIDSFYKQLVSKLKSESCYKDQQIFSSDTYKKASVLCQKVESALVERNITNIVQVGVTNAVVVDLADCNSEATVKLESNGQVFLEEDHIRALFSGEGSTYQLKINFPSPLELANGLSVDFRLSGWVDISYLAIGHTAGKTFRHVKIPNPLQEDWVTFSVGWNDLIFGLQNDWEVSAPSVISDLRLYVKGRPNHQGASIDARWAAAWLEKIEGLARKTYFCGLYKESSTDHSKMATKERRNKLFLAIQKYFKRCNPNIKQHVERFFASGDFPLTGDASLYWSIDQPLPEKFEEVGTYRYLWHAMQPAISLMVYARETKTMASIFAARDFISDWLERSFFNPDPDRKFAWYDHGTAERLLALLFLYELGRENSFDYRFMSRIRLAIFRHGQLLESEAFYAFYQSTRYHNHAWFQDMALIATAIAMDDFPCAKRWLECGMFRLTDQLNKLIVRDNGFAIFVENSIGYHHGIQRLVEFAGELVQISGRPSSIPTIANELNAWSDYLRYPDKRSPSQGDTFRLPNVTGKKVRRGRVYQQPHCLILPKAGYAVVKGNHEQVPFMLCMFATSLSKTHKHEDNLSITLFFDGIEWLIDPSFYSHEYKSDIPAYLRSALAHNNIAIPGNSYSIEPELAYIKGSSDQESFELFGEHNAYSNYKVSRRITGQVSMLNIKGFDCVENLSNDNEQGAYLVFHLGEGVKAKVDEDAVILLHADSCYQLRLECSISKPEVYSGWDKEADFKSVAGAGFMQINDTYTVGYQIEIGHSCQWELKVVKSV
ncbi:DUF6270 domain-containing protein [Peptococcaceae bacterium 1198_IL3148]